MHSEQWFIDRVGKRIYRHTDTKCCDTCQKVLEEGLIVANKVHAQYLYDCQCEMDLIYSDDKRGVYEN